MLLEDGWVSWGDTPVVPQQHHQDWVVPACLFEWRFDFTYAQVKCELCSKWRRLPPRNHPSFPLDLPDNWNCSMNSWEEPRASCEAEEEPYDHLVTVSELQVAAPSDRETPADIAAAAPEPEEESTEAAADVADGRLKIPSLVFICL